MIKSMEYRLCNQQGLRVQQQKQCFQPSRDISYTLVQSLYTSGKVSGEELLIHPVCLTISLLECTRAVGKV